MIQKFEIYQSGNSFYSNKEEAISLASTSFLGEIKEGKVLYSIYEILYLLEGKKVMVLKGKTQISFKELIKKANFNTYIVFKDLRNKGNILKEGLKFGADFRVYNKGDKPGKNHAKYLLHVIEGKEKLNIKDFCAKARVAHSTNKLLLLAVIDSEQDISYYEVNWKSKE
jgi:tRNA-intron endonuclease